MQNLTTVLRGRFLGKKICFVFLTLFWENGNVLKYFFFVDIIIISQEIEIFIIGFRLLVIGWEYSLVLIKFNQSCIVKNSYIIYNKCLVFSSILNKFKVQFSHLFDHQCILSHIDWFHFLSILHFDILTTFCLTCLHLFTRIILNSNFSYHQTFYLMYSFLYRIYYLLCMEIC